MENSVKYVVKQHLCVQCGTCVAICPYDAIVMEETPSGHLFPDIDKGKCVECGKCLEVCPGWNVELTLPEGIDPFKGVVCGAYIGHSSDEIDRFKGQSGGVVSALLQFLLETGRVDSALVSMMPTDGSLRPKSFLAKTKQEILSAQGSKYCPVAANTALKDLPAETPIAAVGVSCQMHGIHMLTRHQKSQMADVKFKIGLFCDRTLLYACTDRMIENAGLNRVDIVGIEYRSKARSGWPGEVCFQLNSGERKYYPSSLRMNLKDPFTPPRCRLCFDKMNILSDLSIGDPHGISKPGGKGESAVVARNERAVLLLEDAANKGYLKLRAIDPEMIFKGQVIEQRRRDFTAYSDIWHNMGRRIPEFEGLKPENLVSVDSKTKNALWTKLLFNIRVSEAASKKDALDAVDKKQRKDKIRTFVPRLLAKFKRIFLSLSKIVVV